MGKRHCVAVFLFLFLLAACGDDAGISAGNSRYSETDWFFQEDIVRDVRITINPDYLNSIVLGVQENEDNEKVYALAAAVSIDGEVLPNIGIRSRGNTSINNFKRQFKISFDCTKPYTNTTVDGHASFPEYDSRRFRGLKKLNLRASQNDPTIIREKIAAYVLREAGAIVPRVGFAKVYVNDEYWGLYLVVEQIDKTFLDAHLNEKNGNLYKAEWKEVGGTWYGPRFVPGSENGFELMTNTELGDKSGLTAFFGGLAAATTPAQLAPHVDIDNVLGYYAGASLVGHWDSFAFGQNNDYLYHHSDGRFRIVVWDLDNTFGSEWTGGTSILGTSVYQMKNNDNYQALFGKLLNDPVTKARYKEKIRSLLDSCFNTGHLFGKIAQWRSVIRSAALADPRKNIDWDRYTPMSFETGNTTWEEGFTQKPAAWVGAGFNNDGLGLEPWITERIARVQTEIGYTPPAGDGLAVTLDPGAAFVTITNSYNEIYCVVLTGRPLTFTAAASGSALSRVDFTAAGGMRYASDSTAPWTFTTNLAAADGWGHVFSIRAAVYNTSGQSTNSAVFSAEVYVGDYADAEDNGNGTFTFRINPVHVGATTGHNIYLAGEMNGWFSGNLNYTTLGAWRLTDRGDGIMTLTTSAARGQKYKFTVDRDGDGFRNDSTDWTASPANPYRQQTGNRNSLIP